ncbi:MAG: class I SAM-dependent methyltransferase [Desulfobacterales bacterium]|nr:class I SAM-dependent methyltransferase [Desulfobacterales bacterium]
MKEPFAMKIDRHPRDTIQDFGEQWTHYPENRGFYASPEALTSLLCPLLEPTTLRGLHLADVGAGTGRYTLMLHELGARKIMALEPSNAFSALQGNTAGVDRIECLQAAAEEIPQGNFDFVFCIGVLQFIPDPRSALRAMGRALGSGGRLFLWVYGAENNGLYLMLVKPLRWVTSRLSHRLLDRLAGLLAKPAGFYARLCRSKGWPLADYMRHYYARLDGYSRKLVIYDQLNPRFAKYSRQDELRALLASCGYADIRMHHHLGYSWSVLARYAGSGASP